MNDLQAKSTNTLALCPFCGGEAEKLTSIDGFTSIGCLNCNPFYGVMIQRNAEAEAIAAWNSRAAMEFDNWFYLPKPKEPIAEVTETTLTWDGTKIKTDVFYQVQEQAVINWAKELDEHIIKRICEVWNSRADYHGYEQAAIEAWESIKAWNSRAERTCKNVDDHKTVWFICSVCGYQQKLSHTRSYCPNCGARVVE